MRKHIPIFVLTVLGLIVWTGLSLLAQQDRYTLKVPDGLAFL